MPTIKVVVLLVRQLRHGFTKYAKVSLDLTVANKGSLLFMLLPIQNCQACHKSINQFPDYRLATLNVKKCAYVDLTGAFIFGHAKKHLKNVMIRNL